MTTLKKITTSATILCLAITMATSCSNDKDEKELAEDANEAKFDGKEEKGADHLVNAYSNNLYEIKVSENAAMNASNPEVKKVAEMMVEAHTKMNADVKKLAESKQVTLPSDLTDDQRKDIEKMTEKTGTDFDKCYIDQMKDKHENAIKMLQKISDKCDDQEIKSWATSTLPEVRAHLDMVNAAKNDINNK